MKTRKPTRAQRTAARKALMKKFWGNSYMGSENPADQVKTTSFRQLQQARRDAWEHGMKQGFAAGVRLGQTVNGDRT